MDVVKPGARIRGFSAVELLTTLTIALVLISAGVPAWQNLIANNSVTSARMLMAGAMALARETAIESRHHLTLCPSSDLQDCSGDYTAWHRGVILFFDSNRNRHRDPGEALVRSIDSLPHVTIHSSTGRRSILYAPNGSAWGSNLTLRFCVPDRTRSNKAIILYGSGRARFSSSLSNGDPITCN